MRVRSCTRSSRWSTSSRTSRSGPSRRAVGKFGSLSAARATASASIGSDLPNERALLRALAISFGGTRTIRSPAASRSRSSRRERWRQSSTAHDRSPLCLAAHATSSRWSPLVVPVVRCASCRPWASTNTTVCERLCASIPIITMRLSLLPLEGLARDRSAGISQLGRCHAPLKPRRPVPRSPCGPHNGHQPRRQLGR